MMTEQQEIGLQEIRQ